MLYDYFYSAPYTDERGLPKSIFFLIYNTLYIVNIRQRNDGNYPILKIIKYD